MKTGTLSRKIVLSFSLISVIVLLLIFWAQERLNKAAFFELEQEKADIIAETVAPLLALDIYLELGHKKDQLAEQLIDNPNILAVTISEGDRIIKHLEAEGFDTEKENYFSVQKALTLPNSDIRIGELELIYSSRRYQELISQYTELLVYLLLGLGVIFLLLGFYIRNLLAPLKKIAKKLSYYRPDARITFPYSEEENEIGIISGALNEMHAKVYENFMKQKEENMHLAEKVDEKEQIIYEANLRFREVFNNTLFGIWVIDKNRETIDANGKLLEILDIDKKEIAHKNILDFVAPQDMSYFDQMSVLDENKPDKQQYEVTLVDSNGKNLPSYFYTMSIRNRDNKIVGAFAFVEDLHEKRMLQAELERKSRSLELLNAKLEEEVVKEVQKRRKSEHLMYQQSRLAAMGELIVAISHNWRNPLNSLGLMIQDLEDAYNYDELDKTYLNDMTQKSNRVIQYMSQTIDDFGNFFKPVGEKERFSIRALVNRTIKDSSNELEKHNITLKTGENAEEYKVSGYPDEIQKIIENLVSNARDAIIEKAAHEPFDGEITISYFKDVEMKKIIVSDNGGGIPADIIDNIFDPYYTTKEQGKGTGLGLYMAKVLIETNMNGKLSVKNDEKGAVFTIELP